MEVLGKHNSASIYVALKAHYADDALSRMIIAAKKFPSTKTLATNFQNEQVRIWLNEEKSADDVFTLLQLNKIDDNLLTNSEFTVWTQYVNKLNPPLKDFTVWSTISSHYADDILAPMLVATKNVQGTEKMATKIQAEQMGAWLNKGKSADEAFMLLQLNKVNDKLLGNPEFMLWSKYVDNVGVQNKDVAMASTFVTHYTDETMIKLIDSAKLAGEKNLVSKMEDLQYKKWLKEKKPAADVFALLKGNKADDKLFDIPGFALLRKYIDDLQIPEQPKKEESMVLALTKYYGDERLAQLLTTSKSVKKTEQSAINLQNAQMNYWVTTKVRLQNVKTWLGINGPNPDKKAYEYYMEVAVRHIWT